MAPRASILLAIPVLLVLQSGCHVPNLDSTGGGYADAPHVSRPDSSDQGS